MAKDYTNQARTAVRRSDREVEDEAWIKQFLTETALATMATSHEDQPFVNSNIFVYDADRHCIYIHTARVGRTRGVLEINPKVCLTVMEMGRFLPAPEALEFSVEYSSVVVFGNVKIVEDTDEAKSALQLLLDKYAPHLKPNQDYRPPVDEELKRTSVFRIDIEEWSGKRKSVADDFPGAYFYEDVT